MIRVAGLLVLAGGFSYGASPEGGPTMTGACSERNIAASAVRTQSDIQAFVACAAEYLSEHGSAEARRAFNEDERWKDGPTYVFVDGNAKSGTGSKTFVYPPNPSREGQLWGEAIDDFGNDLFFEIYRMTQAVDAGWVYYSFPNPATGKKSAKASYVIEIDWDGEPAVIGAGIYSRDWPGTCYADEVNAEALDTDPSAETLREFVRCAAMVVESEGYFAKEEIAGNPRWSGRTHYVYVLDMLGNQVMSGHPLRVNGRALREWGRRTADQFGGRDMVDMGGTFGESYVYYRSYHPMTGADQPKVGFLKRVVAQGVPLLVGAGYYPAADTLGSEAPSCADNYVEAAAVRTQADIRAFVQCAVEYAIEHGEEEARRAFNEDARWKSGPTYVFVDGVQPSGEDALVHVFPPDPSREGSVWGTSIDGFGNDYYYELHRILSLMDEGWIYYAFNNPATGLRQPKSSYVVEIDWNGDRASIGAGIYARDFPGACNATEVNAADLAARPGEQRLQEFVRCAALEVESAGYFAGPVLSSDPRWKQGPIYIFGINAETGMVEFSGNPASFATSGRIPELLFDGRDAIEASALFGESFWYYNFNNPATGEVEPKAAFYKLVRAQGVPLLVGSGYNP
ncbi:MAG: cache domain-containing protein [Rhodospirillales bacterium]|nr:cache domain-containing protein [Rhodospirillales bacterium]